MQISGQMKVRGVLTACVAVGIVASIANAVSYQELGGLVVIEAEQFTQRTANGATEWRVMPDEVQAGDNNVPIANAREGKYVQVLPDDNVGGGGPTNAPSIEYQMQLTTTGTYQAYVRWETDTPVGNSDSMFIDIVEIKDGGGGAADWYELTRGGDQDFATSPWDAGGQAEVDSAGAADNPITWNISSPGTYTLRLSEREDGAAVDALVFQSMGHSAPSGFGPTAPQANETGAFLYYSFESPDTASDNQAADFSGNGRTGSLSTVGSGAFAYQSGAPSALDHSAQSLSLTENGNNNAARITTPIPASDLDFDSDDWTFSGWFQRADEDSLDMIFHIGTGDGFGGDNELYLMGNENSSSLTLRHDPGNDVNITTALADPLGWHHAAVTFDATAGRIALYLDGVFIGDDTSFNFNFNQSAPFGFGGHKNPGFQASRWFNGQLDDLALWARVLEDDEIQRLANGVHPLLAVPEPATAALLGVAVIGALRRRRSA